jgi:penicillin-binding protein 1A
LSSLRHGLPDEAAIRRIGEMPQATSVFDRSDALAFTIFREQRIEVPLAQVSPRVQAAIVAIEDRRFYEHSGFDVVRILSSVWANLRELRLAQGGSTITQQLARQSFLSPQKTIRRKLQELIVARRIEREYSKAQILELYLNKIYFGDGLHGIEAASRGYFGKHAADLSLPEAALLAGLVKSPSNYAPTVNLGRATWRRTLVLEAMLENGAITRGEWEAARTSPVVLRDGFRDGGSHGQYFKELVRRELVDRFSGERVYAGGLRVFTTIDLEMQQAAEAAVATSLAALEKERTAAVSRGRRRSPATAGSTEPLQAALIAMDPATGDVRAIVGGRDFNESPFNRAVAARRQPGSAFKPFVFASALESGYSPATIITRLDDPVDTKEGEWSPEDQHSTAASMSLRDALRTSSNRAAVRLLEDVGIDATVRFAAHAGITNVPSVPSLALGAGDVTLDVLTAAYAAFANGGRATVPRYIRRVEAQDGRVLFQAPDEARRVFSETTAFLMASILADVVNGGTGSRVRALGFTLPAAGKTGTTDQYRDAWFVGFTPALVAGVWVGLDDPQTILPNGYASDVAVPAWSRFMKAATKGDPPRWFSPPRGVTTLAVCRLSGKLATSGCDHVPVMNADGTIGERSLVYKEFFAAGTEPVESCELHARRGWLGTIASAVGARKKVPPVRLEDAALPPNVPVAAPVPARRGFWSRLFRLGRDKR